MIWKVLGILMVALVYAVAAYANPQTTATGPPTQQLAGVQIDVFGSAVIGTANHNTNVAASDIELWFGNTALFMGADKTDEGLLKGPRAYALDQLEFRSNPGAATGVDLLGAGVINTTLFMGDGQTQLNDDSVAFIHAPPDTNTALFCIDFS